MVVHQESRASKTVYVLYNDSETKVLGIYPTEYRARKAEKDLKQKLSVVEIKKAGKEKKK